MVIDLVTFQVLEPYSKTDTTLLLNMRTLRLFGNEQFLQIGDNIPKAALAFLTLQSTSASLPPSLHISLPKYVTGLPLQLGVQLEQLHWVEVAWLWMSLRYTGT